MGPVRRVTPVSSSSSRLRNRIPTYRLSKRLRRVCGTSKTLLPCAGRAILRGVGALLARVVPAFDFPLRLVLRVAVPVLYRADELVEVSSRLHQIFVCQFVPTRLQLSFELLPLAFECGGIHHSPPRFVVDVHPTSSLTVHRSHLRLGLLAWMGSRLWSAVVEGPSWLAACHPQLGTSVSSSPVVA